MIPAAHAPSLDHVIVLAGGRSTRMGADKATIRIHNRRLVDIAVAELQALPVRRVAVVSSENLQLASSILTATEDPPFGGPVAGIHAGLRALMNLAETVHHVGIIAVDAPFSPRVLPRLTDALYSSDAHAACVKGEYLNPLCAVWKTRALTNALTSGHRDRSAKSLFAGLELATIPEAEAVHDADTPDQLPHLLSLLDSAGADPAD